MITKDEILALLNDIENYHIERTVSTDKMAIRAFNIIMYIPFPSCSVVFKKSLFCVVVNQHVTGSLMPVRRKFCGRFFSIILSLPGKNSGSAKSSIICQRFTLLRA